MISPATSTSSAILDLKPTKAQSGLEQLQSPKKNEILDSYVRADGSEATRHDAKVAKPQTEEDKKFREVLHQVVGMTLFGQMLKSMRATQEKNPYFDGGRAEEIFQGQLDQVLVDQMTKATAKTLSDPMYKMMTAKAPR